MHKTIAAAAKLSFFSLMFILAPLDSGYAQSWEPACRSRNSDAQWDFQQAHMCRSLGSASKCAVERTYGAGHSTERCLQECQRLISQLNSPGISEDQSYHFYHMSGRKNVCRTQNGGFRLSICISAGWFSCEVWLNIPR
jgi:hypothetical protein